MVSNSHKLLRSNYRGGERYGKVLAREFTRRNEAVSHKEDWKQAYIYGFPMIAAYKAMFEFAIDKSNSQYKGPFNSVVSDSKTLTPKDTAVVTPNADTPYSVIEMDLRAEPLVICVPVIEKKRYYVVQLSDLYSYNVGYIGSRTTGNDGGCFMVTSPNWKGETPKGIKKVFPLETQSASRSFVHSYLVRRTCQMWPRYRRRAIPRSSSRRT